MSLRWSPGLCGLSQGPPAAASLASCSFARRAPQSATSLGLPAAALLGSPLHPGCPSSPLLLVWVSVSSLSPWLLDFHTVQFSVSFGGFLFLNCCCPSFGCARRHSVSTYSSLNIDKFLETATTSKIMYDKTPFIAGYKE